MPLCLLLSCKGGSHSQYQPSVVNFEVGYNPMFDGVIYPSLLLGYNNYQGDDEYPLFSIGVTAPVSNAVLRVELDSSMLNYSTTVQETLQNAGERYELQPQVKWKYDALRNIRKQGPVDLTFTCYINDEKVDVKNLHLNFRSVNECLLAVTDSNGKTVDFRWLFCAYINEEHNKIDGMLSEMLTQDIVTRFTGYQTPKNSPKDQVKAIWYYALNRGITYSSISCTSNPSKNCTTQHIRFFDEVYNYRQANCIDACVFFASIMRKIGLYPVIFVGPCHAYLGYYTDKNKRDVALLETTVTGWINFPEIDRSVDESTGMISEAEFAKVSKYLTEKQRTDYMEGKTSLDALKHQLADTLFVKASEYNKDDYKFNKRYFEDQSNVAYRKLDVSELRQVVQPIN